jgi:hypothetical protein
MKRYHDEKHIIENRVRLYKRLAGHAGPDDNKYVPIVGKFRKSIKCSGCGRARCQVCHPEKYPKRTLTLKERQVRDNRVNGEND